MLASLDRVTLGGLVRQIQRSDAAIFFLVEQEGSAKIWRSLRGALPQPLASIAPGGFITAVDSGVCFASENMEFKCVNEDGFVRNVIDASGLPPLTIGGHLRALSSATGALFAVVNAAGRNIALMVSLRDGRPVAVEAPSELAFVSGSGDRVWWASTDGVVLTSTAPGLDLVEAARLSLPIYALAARQSESFAVTAGDVYALRRVRGAASELVFSSADPIFVGLSDKDIYWATIGIPTVSARRGELWRIDGACKRKISSDSPFGFLVPSEGDILLGVGQTPEDGASGREALRATVTARCKCE